jgi:hypothetical protein
LPPPWRRGRRVIGLVDGHYEQVASVWHKEILYALSMGVHVFGAASMGALRAAECEAYGMVPVGEIAGRYCRGELYDDDAVALLNGPAELAYAPLTEPLVEVEATLARLLKLEPSPPRSMPRWPVPRNEPSSRIAPIPPSSARRCRGRTAGDELLAAYRIHRVALKSRDAAELLAIVAALPASGAKGRHGPLRPRRSGGSAVKANSLSSPEFFWPRFRPCHVRVTAAVVSFRVIHQ